MNIEKWEKTRIKGKKRFIWVNGFLVWGLSTAILWSMIMEAFDPANTIWIRPIMALVLFPVGRLMWAHFTWNLTEKQYTSKKNGSEV